MGAEVLSAEAGQPLPTRRQRKQGEGLRPAPTDPQASARETPDGRNDPRRVLARAGLRPLPLPLPVARSALSWPALPGERRPGQAQEPQVSRCPGSRPVQATLLQEPSTLSPTSGAPSLHTHTSSSFPYYITIQNPVCFFHLRLRCQHLQLWMHSVFGWAGSKQHFISPCCA